MGGKIEKSHGGPPGTRGGAEAGVRREAPNGGRSGGPTPGGVPEGIFKIPERAEGICRKIHEKNPNLVYIFLMYYYDAKSYFIKKLTVLILSTSY